MPRRIALAITLRDIVLTAAHDDPVEPGTLTIANSIYYQNAGVFWISGALNLMMTSTLPFGSGR